MALDDEETFDRFRTLDSGAIADGYFRDAYVCRSMGRGANYLAKKGHPLLHLLYSAQSVVGEGNVRALFTPVSKIYQRLTPGAAWFRPKKTGLNRATFQILMQVPNNQLVQIQVTTLRQPLQPDLRLDSPRILQVLGTGSRDVYELANVPIDEGPMERIGIFARAVTTGLVAGSVAAHTIGGAGFSTGRVLSITLPGQLVAYNSPPANVWRTTAAGDSWATDHFVMIHDGPNAATLGNSLFQGQVTHVDSADSLWVWPPPATPTDARRLLNRYFAIFELPVLRVFGIAMRANDRA